MTDNDIKKALERCKQGTAVDCKECPLYEDKGHACITILSYKSLDLINRQQAEIERLQSPKYPMVFRSARGSGKTSRFLQEYTNGVRAEAIKEFIKRFEKKIKDVKFTIGQTWEIECALKQTLKEMTEVQE